MKVFCVSILLYVFYICGCVCIKIDVDLSTSSDIGFKKEFYENCGKPNDGDCNHYIDPHDMRNYIHSSKTMSSHKTCHHKIPTRGCDNCAVYLQRFVGLFLGATGLKDYVLTRTNSKMVNLNLIVNRENLEVLQTFMANGDTDLTVINKALTDILTVKDSVFSDHQEKQQSLFETFIDAVMNILKQVFSSLSLHFAEHPMHLIVICVTSVFGITLWQIIKTKSYYLLSFSLFFIIFAAGFAWNWVRLYKIADIKRFTTRMLNDEIPIYCRPDQMTWYQYIFYYSTYERKCEQYFEKVMIDPIVEVAPTVVLAETITFIFYPAERLGSAIGNFVKGLINTVPWPYSILFVPLILILVGIFILVMMIILTKGRLKLNVFPFSYLEISSSHNCNHGGCSLKARPADGLIEDVSRSSDEGGLTGRLLSKFKFKKASLKSSGKAKSSSPGMMEKSRKEVALILRRLNDEDELTNSDTTIKDDVKSIRSSDSASKKSKKDTTPVMSGNSRKEVASILKRLNGEDSLMYSPKPTTDDVKPKTSSPKETQSPKKSNKDSKNETEEEIDNSTQT